jgi:hypothetical protein
MENILGGIIDVSIEDLLGLSSRRIGFFPSVGPKIGLRVRPERCGGGSRILPLLSHSQVVMVLCPAFIFASQIVALLLAHSRTICPQG